MHKHQKLFSGANVVRPLTGAADEEGVSTPQSVGFKLTILKLTGTACLALSLISILTINLINSNYYSPKLANAVSTNTATIANTTNASNASNTSSYSPYISLSLSSATGSSDPSNGSNIAIQVPDAGGLATGSHTLAIKTNAAKGYNVTLSSNSEQTGLVNKKDSITTTIPTITTNGTLANNTWGYSLTKPSDNNSPYIGIKPKSSPDTILESTSPTGTDQATDTGKQQAIYYGVNVPDLNTMKAGTYEASVTYTATANLPAAPTITKVEPNTINTGNTPDSDRQITIAGTDLASAYQTFVDLNNNGKQDSGEQCTNPTVTDTTITCIAPASSTATTHDVYAVTQGGATVANSNTKLTYKDPQSTSGGDGSIGNFTVEWDQNLIPIMYHNNQWVKADTTNANTTYKWFDYANKQWTNAVTVNSEANAKKYREAALGTPIPEADILSYFVYIPRYAYEVMRPNAYDKVVQAQNFDIKFETPTDPKKSPKASCNATSPKDYRTECSVDRTYPTTAANKDNTTWATHPAFSWTLNGKTTELPGIWVGKFETTGDTTAPTIKPNITSLRSQNITVFYNIAKAIGVNDTTNKYGGTVSGLAQNNNHLAKGMTHMMKNSEWGAAAYLSASKYGTGVNNVQINGNSNFTTGCGPTSANSDSFGGNCNAYNTTVGQTASTTGNIYGIYDMSGGAWEYVMGNYGPDVGSSNFSTANLPKPPYVDQYSSSVFTSDDVYDSNNKCTWATCGGQALHETKTDQLVKANNQSWGGDLSMFVVTNYPWFIRGGDYWHGYYDGVFASYEGGGPFGGYSDSAAFRVVLLAALQP